MFSALLSVYNNERACFLDAALASIYDSQTVKPDQIVLVKDGPLTHDLDVTIASWKEKMKESLTVVALDRNVGLGAALNEGLKYCRYELVARMDTDDVALPERFERQIEFMNNNSEIIASSAILEEWDLAFKNKLSIRLLPTNPDDVARFALRRSPLSHPLVVFRKSIILEVGGYPPLRKSQDYALWSILISRGYKLANLPDVLLRMRAGNEMISRRGVDYFKYELQLLKFQREIGFLSQFNFFINVCLRAALRLSPNFIRHIVYRIGR